jgi:taurine dioxygenase
MRVNPLLPIGAEVDGIRVDALSADEVTAVQGLLGVHGVLVFRGQEADDAGFLRFLRSFGDLMFTKGETPVDGYPDLNVISNVGRATPPRSNFHVDTSYVRTPPAYTALRAVEVPEAGGQTLFSNQYRAFETLPADTRRTLQDRVMTHVVTGLELDDDDETSAVHPLVRIHPVTGRPVLYLSAPARCAEISGMTPDETRETIAALIAHSTADHNVLRHAWSPGDVVIWDNRCVMHKADHSGVVGDRVMHRGMVADVA